MTTPWYVPLDELLQVPAVRVLRALSRYDWIERQDLYDALDLPPNRAAPQLLNTYHMAVSRSVRLGHIEARDCRFFRQFMTRDFRITPAGRAWLAKRLRPAQIGVVASFNEMFGDERAPVKSRWSRQARAAGARIDSRGSMARRRRAA